MRRSLTNFFSAPLQLVLVVSFFLVAATTIALGALAISRTIGDYLGEAMTERVTRDMNLARALYEVKLSDIAGIAHRLALDPIVTDSLPAASRGDAKALATIDRQIANKVTILALGGSHFIAVLNADGDVVDGRLVSGTGEQMPVVSGGNWAALPIVKRALLQGEHSAATEVIPAEMLAQVGLAEQARIPLIDTPKAAPTPFDPREGTAGLAAVGAWPIFTRDGHVLGAAVAFHLFNNDFTLVDRIRDVAGIDTVTIFLGDQRVSTNVLTEAGERALGTRISREVRDVVLEDGQTYTGRAFVVTQDYITRYEPLRDHLGAVVGSLYVGVRQAAFAKLVSTFNERVVLIALATIGLALLLGVPVARSISGPLKELVGANRRVAQGDMTVRVPVRGRGEVGLLAGSFNSMLDTLQDTQDQLVQSEKLASLGQLAAGVAHELNNPLGTVLLYSDILLKECPDGDPHQDDLQIIRSEAQRCKNIVSALLNFARQNQVVAQPTDLNALIESVIEVQRKCEAYAQVSVVADFDPAVPTIQADPAQLRQVFINLMVNALEAMPEGGELTLRTRNGPEGMVTAEVEDTGAGIPAENLSKLFTPFFTTKPIGKGTGLGLAIVYGIIKMHRGQITVRSQVGQGTTFTVALPVKLLAAAPANSGLFTIQ